MAGTSRHLLNSVLLLLMTAGSVTPAHASGEERFSCDDRSGGTVTLVLYSREDERAASLGRQVGKIEVYCHYINGHVFEDRISERDIIIFSGFFDHCSQGEILLFNVRSLQLSTISAFTLEPKLSLQCEPEGNIESRSIP